MSAIDQLLELDQLSDLVINGHQRAFANISGTWKSVPNPFQSHDELRNFAIELAGSARKRLDYASPFADVAIGSLRYHLALPLGVGEVHISVRKHQVAHKDLDALLENPGRWAEPLRRIILEKANFIICGGTGTGKTTLLRSLLQHAESDRIVTVEDVSELELNNSNVVALITRQANTDGAGQIDLQRLVIESLRMKPDRLAVGEVRGVELVPMLQALNSGHRGSATTIHANQADAVPARLIGIGLLGGLSPATTAHLAASAFDYVIALKTRVRGIEIHSISSFELTRESRLVTKNEL